MFAAQYRGWEKLKMQTNLIIKGIHYPQAVFSHEQFAVYKYQDKMPVSYSFCLYLGIKDLQQFADLTEMLTYIKRVNGICVVTLCTLYKQ